MNAFYDLHIHSCLSPCGDNDMTPQNIAGMAMLKGLNVIALTDHNSCKNCPALLKAAEEYGILALPGMEMTTAEEVHAVCLFRTLDAAMTFDSYVYEKLLPIANDENIFGQQLIYNEQDEITGKVPNLLINSVSISFDVLWDLVHQYDGTMFPAHIDKNSYSLISNLGFVPPDSQFQTAEVKDFKHLHGLLKSNPYLESCHILSSSDAHYLEQINEACNTIPLEELTANCVIDYIDNKK